MACFFEFTGGSRSRNRTIKDAAILRVLHYARTRGARKYVRFICADDQCKFHACDARLCFELALGRHTRSVSWLETTTRALERAVTAPDVRRLHPSRQRSRTYSTGPRSVAAARCKVPPRAYHIKSSEGSALTG